jgi:hypothetical protein
MQAVGNLAQQYLDQRTECRSDCQKDPLNSPPPQLDGSGQLVDKGLGEYFMRATNL